MVNSGVCARAVKECLCNDLQKMLITVLFMVSKPAGNPGAQQWKTRLVSSYNGMRYDRWQCGWISKTLLKKKPDAVLFKV